ncbi:hypothetical protein PJE062_3225 [Pseudovibrio sp. JE062]|nr:hypothetical protein PJE062_3225 [Pseudovibrio sp. JE062]
MGMSLMDGFGILATMTSRKKWGWSRARSVTVQKSINA